MVRLCPQLGRNPRGRADGALHHARAPRVGFGSGKKEPSVPVRLRKSTVWLGMWVDGGGIRLVADVILQLGFGLSLGLGLMGLRLGLGLKEG